MSEFMRKFVILEEQPGYYKKVQGLTPKGHMNIEVRDGRGKLTLNVDNLKINPDEEKLYKACLIGTDNKDFVDVDLGVIVLNDKGKGSLEWRFDPASVGGTSLSIEKFNNVLVKEVDMANENNDMVIPLLGYIYKKDGSIVKLMKKQAEKELPRKNEIEKQNIDSVQFEKSKIDKEEILEEVEFKETLDKAEIEQNHIQEDTYVPLIEETNIEEIKVERKKIVEEIEMEEVSIEEVNKEDETEEQETEEKEIKAENIQEETQEEVYEERKKEEQIEEYKEEKFRLEIVNTEAKEPENEKTEIEKTEVEDIEFEDIIPIDIKSEELESQEIYTEEEEKDDQTHRAETFWLNLETEEKIYDNDNEDESEDYGFIKMGDDFTQHHQVTYNYGDYIDNLYGNKIKKMDDYIETAKNYSQQVANYTMDILKFFEKIQPFRENLRDCTWWKIEHRSEDFNRGFLPFYSYLVNAYYPYPLTSRTTTCQNLIEEYGHYIFGTVKKQEEIQYYVYGVPGKYTIAEHPYNGATGFNTWLRDKNSLEGLGYWLIYIDALSGKIVNPVNPTIPTR